MVNGVLTYAFVVDFGELAIAFKINSDFEMKK